MPAAAPSASATTDGRTGQPAFERRARTISPAMIITVDRGEVEPAADHDERRERRGDADRPRRANVMFSRFCQSRKYGDAKLR